MAAWQPTLEALVHERYPRLLARACLVTRSLADAEDLVQEALVATFSARARFTSLAEAEQYVRRALVTRSVDAERRRRSQQRVADRVAAEPERFAEIPVPGLTVPVEVALRELPARERACVVLRHLEDLSVRDTAALLRLSEGAVKRYTADGVAALAARLGVLLEAGTPTEDIYWRWTNA